MKTTLNEVLAFCEEVRLASDETNPEVTYDSMIKVLFPTQWKLDNYYLHRNRRSDEDDPDCYCE